MTVAGLAVLGPLAAMLGIVAFRRAGAVIALAGASVGAVAAAVTVARVAAGARFSGTLPGLPGFPLRLLVDPLTAALSITVAVVVLVVLTYAVGYMERERDTARFFAGMTFFAAAMQTVVLAGDWILLLAAWELIGLASYLLIGFWYERPGVAPAATRAFLTTRSADLGLYFAAFTLIGASGTTALGPGLRVGGATATVAGLLLLVAAMGKAAQAPMQGWLQDAMRGPTPVSALLHSATLVAAGAILLARTLPLLPPEVRAVVGIVGGVTAALTGITALVEPDLKRLLAASTSSQLGFMFLALGAGSLVAAVLHLIIHAAMKSALFLGAGVFQEAYGSTALGDLRGAGRTYPRVYLGVAVAGLSLAAIPPLAGFWSKDAIIAAAFAAAGAPFLVPLALVGSVLTGAYVGRMLRLLRGGQTRPTALPGMRWMSAGFVTAVLLAALLGLAVVPIARILGAPVPANLTATAIETAAAVAGLTAGWLPLRVPLPAGAPAWAEAGFRVRGGFVGLVIEPVMALATFADRVDAVIHRGVLGVGNGGMALAFGSDTVDRRGIDELIWGFVRDVWTSGERARRLQTGLVSRELAFAVGGIGVIAAVIIVVR